MDFFLDIFEKISFFDLVYLILTILSLIKCSKEGFLLSILAASKWLLAYVVTLVFFPKVKPHVKDFIDMPLEKKLEQNINTSLETA